jgi:hypothetical protein
VDEPGNGGGSAPFADRCGRRQPPPSEMEITMRLRCWSSGYAIALGLALALGGLHVHTILASWPRTIVIELAALVLLVQSLSPAEDGITPELLEEVYRNELHPLLPQRRD